MAKNDFDIDFDFENEYGFDPKAILDSEYTDDDLDLSQFDDEAMDLDAISDQEFDDFDMDLEEEVPFAPQSRKTNRVQKPVFEEEPDMDADEMDLSGLRFEDDEADYPDDADLTADMDFSRRANFFGMDTGNVPQRPVYEEPVYQQASYEEPEQYMEEDINEMEEDIEEPADHRREHTGRGRKQLPAVKVSVPPVLKNLVRLYFPTQQEIHERMETVEGRRRRKPSKQQIFKEFYLPTVIAGLALVLILSFAIGSMSNAIDSAKQKQLAAEQAAQQESAAAEQLATEGVKLLERADKLAMSYDYDGAISVIDSYAGEQSQEMIAKRAAYVNAKSSLIEHQDPTLIPNLSFHALIADLNRALADGELGGSYNRNFVTTAEFEKILNQLYMNDFVLVNFDSFVGTGSLDGTSEMYDEVSILLPEGKKPVMITETMVNYFTYMIDGNGDGVADSGGDGFASRLVVDDNGDIKAEYVDENNVTQVGNYDLVPILEKFIEEHPDFSYRGARATLAVTGSQGIFGYRIQSDSIATKGQDYYNEQVVGATKVVEALRNKGYRLACYSFDNKDYSNISADQVNQDIQRWKSQIAPVIGEIDTIVFARGTDIGDYTGGKFEVLHAAGFRYMIKSGDSPYTEINNTYVRQTRLMVTGENMVAKSSMFTNTGLFDPNTVLDLASRGNVPVG